MQPPGGLSGERCLRRRRAMRETRDPRRSPQASSRHHRSVTSRHCESGGTRGAKCSRVALLLLLLPQVLLLQLVVAVPMRQSYRPASAGIRGEGAGRPRSPTLGAVPLRRALQPLPDGDGANQEGPCTRVVRDVAARRAAGEFITPSYLRDVRCDARGYFYPVQSWLSVGDSWCVDVATGEELEGTHKDWHPPVLQPEACLARAHPPPGELPLNAVCYTNENPGTYAQQARPGHAACDDQCWWNHCRIQDGGYCPTCMDGLTCAGRTTVSEGFLMGTCVAKDPHPPAQICQDDPDNYLGAQGWNCGTIRQQGICSQDLGAIGLPLVGTDRLIASTVCPLSCNACPPSQNPATDSATSGSGVDPGVTTAILIADSPASTTDTSKSSCIGCWSDTTHSCAAVTAATLADPNYTIQVQDRLARACEAAGSVWKSPPTGRGPTEDWE